jgi:DNA invertase Pin-like site-specific DNA recombinase
MWQLPPLTPDEILLYSRKSRTDDPTKTVEEVLEKHEQMMDEWVERNLPGKGRIPEANRYREVVSGETIDARPAMKEVLSRMESPAIKAILIVEPHRLSRGDLEDIGRLVKLLRYTNTLVITIQYTYDLRDERDRDQFERELKRGNEFLEYQKKIQQNGRLLAVQNGYYIGTIPPYGYNKTMYKEGKKKCYTLEVNPEQAPIVKLIFEMYRDGYGSHRIARELNKMGVKTAKGNKWVAESLSRIRINEHYLGKVVWNRRKEVKLVEDGEIIKTRPMFKDYLVYPGKHPAIIDQDLWDAVQEIRGQIPPTKGKAKHANPLAGLVFCQCGRSMSRRTYKNKKGERAPSRLLCDDQANCGTPSCLESEMHDRIVQVLQEAIADFDLQIKTNNNDTLLLHNQLIQQHEKRLEELTALEVSQWEKYTLEDMPKHVFDMLNQKVLAEKAEVQQALCTMRDSVPEPVDYEKKKLLFSDALATFLDPEAPVKDKNLLMKQCIDRIEYDRKKKAGNNRRWGNPEPLELDVHLRV